MGADQSSENSDSEGEFYQYDSRHFPLRSARNKKLRKALKGPRGIDCVGGSRTARTNRDEKPKKNDRASCVIIGETEASRKSNNSFDDIDSNGNADGMRFSQQS